ncbi:MAG TPA: cyclic nucleotide-binding domain-containing protein [Polyangiaceae bacterium]
MTEAPPSSGAIPAALDDDSDDVAWALQTAAVQWNRGAFPDALVWLRRAVEAATDAGADARAWQLGMLADSLSNQIPAAGESPSEKPKPPVDDEDRLLDADEDDEEPAAPGSGAARLQIAPIAPSALPPKAAEIGIPAPPPRAPPTDKPRLPFVPPPPPPVHPAIAPPTLKSAALVSNAATDDTVEEVVTSAPEFDEAPTIPPSERALSAPEPATAPLPGLLGRQSEARDESGHVAVEAVEEVEEVEDAAVEVLSDEDVDYIEEAGEEGEAAAEAEPAAEAEAEAAPEAESEPTAEAEAEVVKAPPEEPAAEAVPAPEVVEREPAKPEPETAEPVEAGEPTIGGISLAQTQGLEDLPEESQRLLVSRVRMETLKAEEEVSDFAAALVLEGSALIMPAIADVSSARVAPGEVVFTRGTLGEGVLLRVVAEQDNTVIAVWEEEAWEQATSKSPWVADELRLVADRFQALAGVTMGAMGERLDQALRSMVTEKCEVRALLPSEILVAEGNPVGGLYVVGAGWIEVVQGPPDSQKVEAELGPGDFLFAPQVLSAGSAPATARAGKGGALVLFADRRAAHELMVSVPPLLELLAG